MGELKEYNGRSYVYIGQKSIEYGKIIVDKHQHIVYNCTSLEIIDNNYIIGYTDSGLLCTSPIGVHQCPLEYVGVWKEVSTNN